MGDLVIMCMKRRDGMGWGGAEHTVVRGADAANRVYVGHCERSHERAVEREHLEARAPRLRRLLPPPGRKDRGPVCSSARHRGRRRRWWGDWSPVAHQEVRRLPERHQLSRIPEALSLAASCTAEHSTVQCSTIQDSTVKYCTVRQVMGSFGRAVSARRKPLFSALLATALHSAGRDRKSVV